MTASGTRRSLFFFAVATVICLAMVWLCLGQKAFEKIATSLAMPCGVFWYVLSAAGITMLAGQNRKAALPIAFTWLFLTVCGNGVLSSRLARSLEAPFMNIQPLQQQPFDVVVVLGGGASTGRNNRHQGNGSGDRLILAAQLYHQKITPKFIVTGRRIASMNSSSFDPADQSADILMNLGVPENAIEKLGGRTTSEEMKALGTRFGTAGLRVGLVTSAWHLPRAMRLAERNGFHPQPLPADFMSGEDKFPTVGEMINSIVPQADAFTGTTRVAKEYLGMAVGR